MRNEKGQFVKGGPSPRKGTTMSALNREAYKHYWKSKEGKDHGYGAAISRAMKGRKKTPEHLEKIATALRGRKRPDMQGKKHFAWKGELAHYDSLHNWVVRYRGKKKECSHCGLNDSKKTYHWANLSGEYKRELDDWVRLCVPCHSKMDKGRGSMQKIWVKSGHAYLKYMPK